MIQNRFKLKRIYNDVYIITSRYTAKGYQWRIHARRMQDGASNEETFQIKLLNNKHTYMQLSNNSKVTSMWIARFLDAIKMDP